ncbi:hypothetical protein BKM31_34510 [[Actinomadura] parvosata subsp. kistnae]|uniref:AB hydrolase-1 domain-containing protein n=1 Tax=[Actinomadura] parvosata subsp. kistnae TaxID=1909395 RepID=A0A1V0AKX7_9ACTN|nr:hypothetical protein BKM31_34510 [Nonomuraea sp. ATCC 55076]
MHQKADVIQVPGATLRYNIRGAGPLLLLVAGGDGDAEASAALADRLAGRYTVLTYDRRGLSGSVIDASAGPPTIGTHADDVHRLLAAVTDEPALVFASSIGAMIGLELVARHPEQVRRLVAHEPPATQFLPEAEREAARRDQREVEEAFRVEGAFAALRRFLVVAGIDPADREEEVVLTPPGPDRLANLTFFLTHDAPAVRRHRLDEAALKAAAPRIVPAVGASSGPIMPYRCALRLAARLGLSPVEFPGGHNAALFRPKAFSGRLREILDDPSDQHEKAI